MRAECRGESVTAAETAVSSSPSAVAADELEKRGSFDEMEFLKFFDGDEETIGRHFITERSEESAFLIVFRKPCREFCIQKTTGKGTNRSYSIGP